MAWTKKQIEQHKKTGFTLIELLVVISIIGFLASAVMVGVNLARIKARDARRVADLRQIKSALDMYYDKYNRYPMIGRWATSEPTTYDSGSKWAALKTALSEFMPNLPNDPKPTGNSGPWNNGNYHYAYGVSSSGQVYDLVAQLEQTNNQNVCQYKCWKYHAGEGSYPPETSWCGGSVPACGGSEPWSRYMVADH
ncbi:MAG: prepilin-type N-terminal cleavage/methylation domain-containing protein [Patescibacteria group bacterium]|jgi:prepilin-type N-terminal cleavage/methylation domain-containing protein